MILLLYYIHTSVRHLFLLNHHHPIRLIFRLCLFYWSTSWLCYYSFYLFFNLFLWSLITLFFRVLLILFFLLLLTTSRLSSHIPLLKYFQRDLRWYNFLIILLSRRQHPCLRTHFFQLLFPRLNIDHIYI